MSHKDEGGLGILAMRLAGGTLLAMHGAQKLFGSFNGPGLETWTVHVESMGIRPAKVFGPLGALSEFGGGTLTALGLLNPLGPLAAIASMTVAARKVHWGKPVFVTEGGAELPLINIGLAPCGSPGGAGAILS